MSIFDDLFGTSTSNVTYSNNTNSAIPNLNAGVQDAINEAGRLYNQGPAEYYSGNLVAPLSGDTTNSMDMIRQRATDGSPLMDAAQAEMMKTVQGDYLGQANPYLDDAIQAGFSQARTGIDAQFGAGGRYGSGLHKIGLGEAFGNIAAPLKAKAYETERDRQMMGMAASPSFAANDYLDAGALANVGAMQQQYDQDLINSDLQKWNYNRNAPQDMLTNYMNMLSSGGAAGGTTSTQVRPMTTNNTANTFGSAITAGNLVGQFTDNPWMVGGGALLGGLFG